MHPASCCNCGRPTFSRVVILKGSVQRPICHRCDGRLLAQGLIHHGGLKNARVYPESKPVLLPPPRLGRFFLPLTPLAPLLLLVSVSFG